MTNKEIENWMQRIDAMSHEEMATLWRFAPSGHPVFDAELPLFEYFYPRFKAFGGMTPTISKRLGWGKPNAT